ncbi:hypothetical protein quinque_003059 [Culex quinquefasciatus]
MIVLGLKQGGLIAVLLVAIVASASANPKLRASVAYHIPGHGDSHESSHEVIGDEVNLPQWYDDVRFNLALDRLSQAASNLIIAYPLASVNDYMGQVVNDVYSNFDLFGFGPSQAYIREAEHHLKGHQAQYHRYEHL